MIEVLLTVGTAMLTILLYMVTGIRADMARLATKMEKQGEKIAHIDKRIAVVEVKHG